MSTRNRKAAPVKKEQPLTLTPKEQARVDQCIYTYYTHFKDDIRKMATLIDHIYLGKLYEADGEDTLIEIYFTSHPKQLKDGGILTYTTFFVLVEDFGAFYSAEDFDELMELITILKKNFLVEQHKHKMWAIQHKERESNKKLEEADKLKAEAIELQSKLSTSKAA